MTWLARGHNGQMSAVSRSGVQSRQPRRAGPVRPRRDFEALTARRLRAAEMFDRGKRQVDVVIELGVPPQTASRWHRAWAGRGRAGLAGAGRSGRRRKLTDAQLGQVEAALLAGPAAHGFATQMWTLARGGGGDRAGDRGAVFAGPDLGGIAGAAGLVSAAAGPAGGRAGRGGDRCLG